jgi:hypothetical protein
MNLAQSIDSVAQRPAEMLTGTVVAVSATTLTVLIRNTSTSCAYLRVAAAQAPVVGDLVAVLRQDSTYLALGAIAGVGGNQVANFSFEQDGQMLGTPTSWNVAAIAGAAVVQTIATGYAPAGTYELGVFSAAAADTYVYSNAIAVAVGQTWAVSALASAVYPSGAPTADAALYGLWFANSTNLYPTTSAADTLIAQVNDVGPDAAHSTVSGVVTVPAGAAFMRVATRSISGAGITMLWDAVVCRRLT